MAHDYQYWRRSRRTNTAAYRFFSGKGGGPDVIIPDMPAAAKMPERAPTAKRSANSVYWRQNAAMIGDLTAVQTQISNPYPAKRRTANTVYWRQNAAVVGDDVFVHTNLPARAPSAPRSANTAYWRNGQARIFDEVPQNGRIHEPRLIPRRAANSAYTRDNKLQINDEVPTNDRIFSLNPPVRRAANSAYFVNPTAVVADVTNLPPIVPVITDFARSKARTANAAYWQSLSFQIDDLEVPQRGRAMDQVHPYRRGANSSYFVATRISEDEFPTTAPTISDIYRRARAGSSAYSINERFVVANVALDPPPIATQIADIHRRARIANTAYWKNSNFVVEDFEFDPPPIFPVIADIARVHRYRSNNAPWRWLGSRGGGIDVEPLNDTIFPGPFEYRRAKLRSARQNYQFAGARQLALLFKPEGTILFPEHNNTRRRRKEAANTAYWRPNTGQIVYVDFGAELSAKLLPQRYWTPLRTANTAYWKNNPGPIPVIAFLEELSAKLLPNRAPGARRGVNTVYSVTSRYMEDTVAFDSVIGAILLPDRVYQQQRASEFAYWMPPPFLVQFPAPLAPLIIGKARVQTLWANDREFIIPAKRRKFPQKPKRP